VTRTRRPKGQTSAVAATASVGNQYPIDEILRLAIRRGELRPGSRLVQRTIASLLGVSRIPVREALRQLAAEGLIVFESGQSARVMQLSGEDIDQLYSLRLLIEPAMAEAIIRNHRPSDRIELGNIVQDMEAATGPRQRAQWSDANFRFHDILCRASGLHHYHRIAIQLLTLTETYSRVFVFELAGRDESQLEHHQMLAALDDGDAQALELLLRKHLSRAHDDLVRYTNATAHDRLPGTDDVMLSELVRNFAEQFKSLTT
jgi:DNA-binding GntR family transcriptional regulator